MSSVAGVTGKVESTPSDFFDEHRKQEFSPSRPGVVDRKPDRIRCAVRSIVAQTWQEPKLPSRGSFSVVLGFEARSGRQGSRPRGGAMSASPSSTVRSARTARASGGPTPTGRRRRRGRAGRSLGPCVTSGPSLDPTARTGRTFPLLPSRHSRTGCTVLVSKGPPEVTR